MTKKKSKLPSKTNLTVSIDTDYYEYLKRLSYKLSAKENNKISLSEVVRRALDSYCPLPADQMTMNFKKEEVEDGIT